MLVVIFRATVKQLDEEYGDTAALLRDAALNQFGCLAFHAASEGEQEIAISYWPDQESIRKWQSHADHVAAQNMGREKWYASYSVEVAEVIRAYGHSNQ